MLVTRVLGDCPDCGGKARFGNVAVSGNQVIRGCMSCKYTTTIWLPETKKKILYLDQFFFSNVFKERDTRFVEAAQRIRRISSLQLLVAPYSSIHEDETHQWRGYDGKSKEDLMEFIKATSRGHEFEAAYNVERTQLVKAFKAFLAGEPEQFSVEEHDALEADIHEWDGYFRIDVGHYIDNIELKRDLKRKSIEALVDTFPAWRKSTNSFDQDVMLELQAAAKGYIDSYFEYASLIASGDYSAMCNSPIMSSVVESLLYCFPNEMPPDDRLIKIGEFFRSGHFDEVPDQWLSARIYAVLKDMVKRGAHPDRDKAIQRLRGFFLDVTHIATYAPYCDAFVMDQAMAALVAEPRIDLESRYGVKVFSLKNWQQFIDWLDSLEAGMSREHREGLAAAYP